MIEVILFFIKLNEKIMILMLNYVEKKADFDELSKPVIISQRL